MRRRPWIPVLLALALTACGRDTTSRPDGGPPDGPPADGGALDGALPDAGRPDSGIRDAGRPDAGRVDDEPCATQIGRRRLRVPASPSSTAVQESTIVGDEGRLFFVFREYEESWSLTVASSDLDANIAWRQRLPVPLATVTVALAARNGRLEALLWSADEGFLLATFDAFGVAVIPLESPITLEPRATSRARVLVVRTETGFLALARGREGDGELRHHFLAIGREGIRTAPVPPDLESLLQSAASDASLSRPNEHGIAYGVFLRRIEEPERPETTLTVEGVRIDTRTWPFTVTSRVLRTGIAVPVAGTSGASWAAVRATPTGVTLLRATRLNFPEAVEVAWFDDTLAPVASQEITAGMPPILPRAVIPMRNGEAVLYTSSRDGFLHVMVASGPGVLRGGARPLLSMPNFDFTPTTAWPLPDGGFAIAAGEVEFDLFTLCGGA